MERRLMTIRITEEARKALKLLAVIEDTTMADILEDMILSRMRKAEEARKVLSVIEPQPQGSAKDGKKKKRR